MFFTGLLLLWLVLLSLFIYETRLLGLRESTRADIRKLKKLRHFTLAFSMIIWGLYIFNLIRNVNIQNVVMTTLMLVLILLNAHLNPKQVEFEQKNSSKGVLITRNSLVALNVLVIFVHFVIFVILRR